jgi:Ca2+-binding RTX toxin-like protein
MMVASWLRPLRTALTRYVSGTSRRKHPSRRMRLEALEDRTVPIVGSPANDIFTLTFDSTAGEYRVSVHYGDGTPDLTNVLLGSGDILDGDGGTDRLVGPDGSATWTMTGPSLSFSFVFLTWALAGPTAGVVNGVRFTNVEYLIGGAGENTLVNGAGFSGDLPIYGPPAAPPIIGYQNVTTDDRWEMMGAGEGTLNGKVAFANMDTLTGGGGRDTIDYSAIPGPVTVHMTDLSNIERIIATGSASDVVVGRDQGATWGPGEVTDHGTNQTTELAGFELFTGGSGDDTFVIVNDPFALNPAGRYYESFSASINGGSGTNRLEVVQIEDYRDDVAGLVVDLHDPRSGRIADTLGYRVVDSFRNISAVDAIPYLPNTVIGPDNGARWTAGAAGVTVAGVQFTGVQTLIGGRGADQFTVSGNFQPAARLTIHGMAGDDDIQVSGTVTAPLWLYGDDGNDRLNGGNGPNVLLGGAGNDTMTGGSGCDLLIGGAGADQIVGNGGDDLMIGGTTAFESNEAALQAIDAEWTSGHEFATRIANLSGDSSNPGFGNRLNVGYFLIPQQTLFADGAMDSLTGSSGSDWYIVDASDLVNGANNNDKITRIGP